VGRIAGVTAAETRRRLLRATAEVFAAHGYEGTRVADIVAAAGVSNGALYAHFGSKAELLAEALRTREPRLPAHVLRAIRAGRWPQRRWCPGQIEDWEAGAR
jgi:AcrR family transcriptional regulator